MMENELLSLLLRATLISSLAIVLVLALRFPLRRLFGCGVAYGAWLAVPLCTLAALLPAAPAQLVTMPLVTAARPLAQAVALAAIPAPGLWAWAVLALWLAGALCMSAHHWRQQRRFMLALGTLQRASGFARAASSLAGPALIGLRHPVIVVPSDFEQRYTAPERALILAHERCHSARRDPLANLAGAAFQCLWWFNPLAHLGVRLARLDQELACDAEVMRAHPGLLREYASAMLKTQLAPSGAALACQWQSTHPLKERIMNLNRNASRTVRLAGRAILAATLAGASYAAWAVQATPGASAINYEMALELDTGGLKSRPTLRMAAGEQAAVSIGEGAQNWKATFVLNPAAENMVYVKMTLAQDGKSLGAPAVLVKPGEQSEVRFELENKTSVAMRMKVSPTATLSKSD